MDKTKLRRVNFRINHCSSEDPEYPASELLYQSQQAKGWQSKRFSSYPQTLVIELVEPTVLKQIAILSHQSKIARKIQIQCKLSAEEEWRKLGYVSLQDNFSTNFQTRELRKANINNIPALILRFSFRQNHLNDYNVFKQVGIISLCIFGDKYSKQPSISSLPLRTDLDQVTVKKLKELERLKKEAVENEQFDTAKNIKDQIERLKSVGNTIIALQEQKQEAIKRQDYQAAQSIKKKIQELRKQQAEHNNQQPLVNNTPNLYETNNSNSNQSSSSNKIEKNFYPPSNNQYSNQYQRNDQKAVSPTTGQNSSFKQGAPSKPQSNQSMRPKQNPKQLPVVVKSNSQDKPDPQEIPIMVKNKNPYAQFQDDSQQPQGQKVGQVEPLNKELLQKCSEYFNEVEQDIFQLIFSKEHEHREQGIREIMSILDDFRGDKDRLVEACLFIVRNLIDDKVASVLLAATELMGCMLKKLKPVANSHKQPHTTYIVEKMADHLGNNSEKIKACTQDVFSSFPIYHLISKETCYHSLCTTGKRQKPPKLLIGRLKMLGRLVQEFQLGSNYAEVVQFVVKYADDKNNEVRAQAVNAIRAISNQIGYNQLKPYLKGLRPQIIKTIQEKLETIQTNYDDRPIRSSKQQTKKQNYQIESMDNEFIQMERKPVSRRNQAIKCQFCGRTDERFVEEDYKDLHYFHACPMLKICSECNQAIQISCFTAHQVGECKNNRYYRKCPRCKQAVHQKDFKAHVERKECLSAKPPAENNRCPLCHLDIPPGSKGWRTHLVQEGCQNNPRQ